ncbi:MAG: bifunctional acetate--CoA ligase family protein/GNAT family N-acetyltransferase [Nevskia sp.]|nr:bifunctional acetate--CoA ligase family protein/GNAT family N-acetyltransferase [Nevskia sp.]
MSIRNLAALLAPRRVVVLGEPASERARWLVDNLHRCAPAALLAATEAEVSDEGSGTLAIAADAGAATPEAIEKLGTRGARALIWPHRQAPDVSVLRAARTHLLRILGPRSSGVLNPSLRLAASALPASGAAGPVALIVQSQSVAAAAVDWASGRRLGFSWVAATGGECDVDVADLLDYAALDPATRAVALEVGHIRGARKFMSAARACARTKPTVVLQTQLAETRTAGSDPVRSAAFARAGMVECQSLPALFDAIAALQRLPPLSQVRVLVAGNGAGICALGVDAVLRHGLSPATPAADTWAQVLAAVPDLRRMAGAADLGEPEPEATVAALRAFLADADIDLVLYLRSPLAGRGHEAVAARLARAGFDQRLLTVWLGLETALPARRISAEANLATFTSPDAAARAIRYRFEYARNRELLTQTPPRGPTAVDHAAEARRRLQRLAESGVRETDAAAALHLAAAYGIAGATRRQPESVLAVSLHRHVELGMVLEARLLAAGAALGCGRGFPPLDPLLAQRVLADAGVREAPPAERDALTQALIRIGQIALDQPAVEELELHLVWARGAVQALRQAARLRLTAEPAEERARLALAPYPAALTDRLDRNGKLYVMRPVQPADEPALIRLLQGLDPESVRLRFFCGMRHFSHEMAARMTQIDYDRELALVIVPDDAPETLLGIGTLAIDPDGTHAEFAVLVDPRHRGLGLGRQLLEKLVQHARARGVLQVYGEVLRENLPMLKLAESLGFSRRPLPDDPGTVRVEIATA